MEENLIDRLKEKGYKLKRVVREEKISDGIKRLKDTGKYLDVLALRRDVSFPGEYFAVGIQFYDLYVQEKPKNKKN